MTLRVPALALVIVVSGLVGATAVFALPDPGGFDEGPYTACVNSKSGAVTMDDPVEGQPTCNSKSEYGVAWANGFSIWDYSNTNFYGEENVTASTWFHQLACPEGTEPLGGGGAFLNPDDEDTGGMALQSSVPTVDDDLGEGIHGWEVFFVSVDGQEHTGTFQIFVTCAPATLTE
ncbi:MAG: hypothetical protein M3280_13400 [Actinomycetota bacterium]|nr:hypothetical protein [Actinomycetota bacterium]